MELVVKNPPGSVRDIRDVGFIHGGWEDPLEKYLLYYSCLENPMDRGAWQAMVHGVSELDMTEAT